MPKTDAPTYISVSAAVEKYGVSEKVLLKRIKSGKLVAAQLPDGEYLVAEHDIDPSLSIKREDFEHLHGQEISASAAERKYDVNSVNFSKWSRQGYIKRLCD